MGRQTAAQRANQAPAKSSPSSDASPSPGRSRPTTGTKPQRRAPSAGRQPSRESLRPRPPAGAATQGRTEAEHSRNPCRLQPEGLALVPVPCCEHRAKLSGELSRLQKSDQSEKGSLAKHFTVFSSSSSLHSVLQLL